MVRTTIDSIVRQKLIDHQLSIHYYVQFLNYALSCVRDLEFVTPISIKSVQLDVNEFGEVTIPTDYVQYIQVSRKRGIYLVPMVEHGNFNPLENEDADGNQIAYTDTFATDYDDSFPIAYAPTIRMNSYGEFTGRYYGGVNQNPIHAFRVLEDRGVIQFEPAIEEDTEIVLTYHYRGTSVLSEVHPLIEKTIGKYIDTEYAKYRSRQEKSGFNRFDYQFEDREYRQAKMLAAIQFSPLTMANIKQALRKGRRPSKI